jgi:hypothetical protein
MNIAYDDATTLHFRHASLTYVLPRPPVIDSRLAYEIGIGGEDAYMRPPIGDGPHFTHTVAIIGSSVW